MPVLFITDMLIFLLLIMVIGFVFYARRHEHLRAPWREVIKRPIAVSSAVVLSIFVIIGLLDSLHFHPALEAAGDRPSYSNEVLSVLDLALTPIRTHSEKTYSAPLATHAYSMELIESEQGAAYRGYPRLQFGGAHLKDPEREHMRDISLRIVAGLAIGIAAAAVFIFSITLWRAKKSGVAIGQMIRQIIGRNTTVPWYAIFATLLSIFTLTGVIVALADGYHVFGTDKVGQDVLYQSIKSIRTGLVIGMLTTLIMLPFALIMGLMAGYFRGWIDDVIQYLYTTLNSIPGVLLIAAAVLLLQVYMANNADQFTSLEQRSDLRLLFLCMILGITSWTGLCRLLRGEALKLRTIDYVQAAQAFGVGHFTIMRRHLLPNVMHIVIISIVLDFSGLVLAEAVLSYINIGVDPSMHSWGNMINSARLEMARDPIVWWSLVAAFIFMFLLVLAANLFADAVRDAFDPRIRGS